jgi:hypothetical protein
MTCSAAGVRGRPARRPRPDPCEDSETAGSGRVNPFLPRLSGVGRHDVLDIRLATLGGHRPDDAGRSWSTCRIHAGSVR